jgi:hypothetical protein
VSADATGNVAVVAAVISAIAAIATGIVSALVSLSLSKRNRSQRIAEFRQEWIENLRRHVSEFVGLVHRIRNVSLSDELADSKNKQFEQYNADLMRIESFISLLLNHDEAPSKQLVNVVAHSRGGAAHVSVEPSTAAFRRIDDHLEEIDAVTRIVLKWEWNRVQDEMKPFSKEERKRREDALLAKLESIPNSIEKYVRKGVK